jgi:hypothetical protein
MRPNLYLYQKLKSILKDEFKQDVIEYDDGNHITLGETGIWISCDSKEITIGFGMNHTHYDFDFDSLEDAIDIFFLLLTKKKKITNYKKGESVFKSMVEIEIENEESINLGITGTIPIRFWKKTEIEVSYQNKLLTSDKVSKQWKELITYSQKAI